MPIRISGSTGISGLDGSATTPVLQGASANASGIYYSGNTVFVSTSGTNALTIGPTGNVALTNNNFSIAGQYISPYSGMMKNRIINGDFRIDQRFNGAANTNNLGPGQYVVDRWNYSTSGTLANKIRFQQNNTNGPGTAATRSATGFSTYFGANVVSTNTVNSTDYNVTGQLIEGINLDDLNWGTSLASPITLSFWVYSSIAGTHSGAIRNANNYDRNYVFSYSVNSANTWEQKSITVPGDTTGTWWANTSGGMSLVFSSLGVGSTYSTTPGSWQAGNYFGASGSVQVVNNANGSFYLTGVQLEKGSQATAWDWRHYTTELQLCQRYYQVYGGNGLFLIGGYGTTGVDIYNMFSFPVQMRISPTVSSLGSWSTNNTNTPYPKVTRISSYGFCVYATVVTTGSWYVDGNSSSTLITASAELGIQN